ncbi:MAG: serine hydrolase [Acaryochloris sp. RU_4_1]|nr:serine hydrolase [Acaryochloris sp. SU_5_25]NJM65491.1 serine hydrolase [Acaryochloris sp. RU_4_1]NJR53422.1 serine hydrolase [Acaryochloris sp. CRU_2_0]
MTRFSRVLILLGGLVSGVAVVGSGLVVWNWAFIHRAFTYPDDPVTRLDWYQPMETVPGGAGVPLPSANTQISAAALDEIERYAQTQNSAALLVMHQGKIVRERYWRGHDPDAYTNSMSMAKTVLSLLIGIAIGEGHIQSELDPVAKYVPEWVKDERSKITIQDLLRMQSGLRDYESSKDPFSDAVQMYLGSDANATALKVPAQRPPGQQFEYVNANSQILGLVLERATGERFGHYLTTRLWQPLGAQSAQLWLDRPRGNPKPFCCLFARSRDWLRVGQLLLQSGKVGNRQIVPTDWIKKMITPSKLEPRYGYHIWLQARTRSVGGYDKMASESFLATDLFYLDGAHHQRVYVVPSYDLIILRVGESAQTWDDAVLANTLIRDLRSKASRSDPHRPQSVATLKR